MLSKVLFVILISIISVPAGATDCLLNQALKDPNLSSNPKFWEDLSQLSEKGKPSDQAVKALIARHGGHIDGSDTRTNAGAPSFNKPVSLIMDHKAEKEIHALPKNLKSKVDEFLEVALKPGGMHELHENPGRWHLEKIVQEGNKAHTVRLNDGYRILFDYSDDGLKVRRVNKGQIHGN